MNPILIGSGFYATKKEHAARVKFYREIWIHNSLKLEQILFENARFRVVDNSELGLPKSFRDVRIHRNLGHAGDPFPKIAGTPLLGWSVSWLIPALVAYSEGCDFIYKEQDCLAFGDWLPMVRRGRASFGRNDVMPCEQSLFFIRHDFILEFIRQYLNLPGHDAQISTEHKFRMLMDANGDIEFHDLPGGRNRPLPDLSKPFYLQRITPEEMQTLREAQLI